MSTIKVNNFIPRQLQSDTSPEYEQSPFDSNLLKEFKDIARHNEMQAFEKIVSSTPDQDLNSQDKEIIREELQTQNSMILMIFRFFLQSGEYSFFVKRLKNVVMTKMSLKQLRTNETILIQRGDQRVLSSDKNHNFSDPRETLDQSQLQQQKNDHTKPQSSNNVKSYSLYTTPQKHSGKSYNVTTNVNQQSTSFNALSTQKEYEISRRENSHQPQLANRQPLVLACNVLNQKDGFQFKNLKCLKGKSPKKFTHQRAMTFGAALASIQSLGIDVSNMRDYMQDQQRIGPMVSFKGINEASGGYTPPLLMQSDSDKELTPTRSELDSTQAKPIIQSLQTNQTKNQIPEQKDESDNLFAKVDVQYVMNILRHQASKNHNKIEEEDLSLCLQIVCRSQFTNQYISQQVKKLFDEIIVTEAKTKRTIKGQQRWLYFEEILGPITIANLWEKEAKNIEKAIVKAFESFKLQYCQKMVQIDDFKRFIASINDYMKTKIRKNENSSLLKVIEKTSVDHIQNKLIQFDGKFSKIDLQKWLQSDLNETQDLNNLRTQFQNSLEINDSRQYQQRRNSNTENFKITGTDYPPYRPNTANVANKVNHQPVIKEIDLFRKPNNNNSLFSNYQMDQRMTIQNESSEYQIAAIGTTTSNSTRYQDTRLINTIQTSSTQNMLQGYQRSQLSTSQMADSQIQPHFQGSISGKILNSSSGNIGASSSTYQKNQQQMFRMSDGFQQQKQNEIFKLKPQVINSEDRAKGTGYNFNRRY